MNFIKELAVKVLELWLWVITSALASLSSKNVVDPLPPQINNNNSDEEEPIVNKEEKVEEEKDEDPKDKPKFDVQKKDIIDKETGELLETRVIVHILGINH